MAQVYSVDLRERILKDIDAGISTEDVARKYSVSISWAYSLQELRRTTGAIEPKKYKPGQPKKLAPRHNVSHRFFKTLKPRFIESIFKKTNRIASRHQQLVSFHLENRSR